MTAQPPKLIASRQVHQGRTIAVRVDELELASGQKITRDVVVHPGAVVIVAVDDHGRILWERQYRHAAGRVLLELPAGTLEVDEAPEVCANRELIEETGFAAGSLRRLGGFYSAPGFCSEYLHAFVATDLRPEEAPGDEDEDIEVLPLSLAESLARIDAGEVEDAKSLATLHLYLRLKPS